MPKNGTVHLSGAVSGGKSAVCPHMWPREDLTSTLLICSSAVEPGLFFPVWDKARVEANGGFGRLGPSTRVSFRSFRAQCPSLMTYLGITWRIYVFQSCYTVPYEIVPVENMVGWGYSSWVEYFPNMCKAPGSISSSTSTPERRKPKKKDVALPVAMVSFDFHPII